MEINKTLNNGTLTVSPVGRIDIVTAPELEEVIFKNLDGVKAIILDCEQLIYISSAGLRVVLRAHKRMEKESGSLKVIHVNELVMEVFEAMGFVGILTIE